MHIVDRVYGEIQIADPLIIELLQTPAMKRLNGVDQAGYFEPFFPGTKYSRYEHSIGVWYLLHQIGASPEEQIAGLIHDVSHTAFSHCIDYIVEGGSQKEQSHQDDSHAAYVLSSDIPNILLKHGFDVLKILDDSLYPLKEKEIPDLCADRIDYALRGALVYRLITESEARSMVGDLQVQENTWVFGSYNWARKYAELFYELNKTYYSGWVSAMMFRTVGDYIGYALAHRLITRKDLYTTDDEVLAKIATHHHHDQVLYALWLRMTTGKGKVVGASDQYDARVFTKSRIVDPLCMHEGKLRRISDIDVSWKEIVRNELAPKEHFLVFFN